VDRTADDPSSGTGVTTDVDSPERDRGEPGEQGTERRTILGDRLWPVVVSVVFVVLAWAYMIEWAPLVRHLQYWTIPGDIWGTYRAAHFVGWGYIGGIYTKGTGLIAYPGIAVVLSPVAMLTSALRLPDSVNPIFLARPKSWLFLGNAVLLLGITTIFAVNRLAIVLAVRSATRALLCVATAVVLWPVIVSWGHPEDCLALTFAIFALVEGRRGQWRNAGWLWGFAVAVQPLVLLMFPPALSAVARGQRIRTCVRAVLPATVLLAFPLVMDWHDTVIALTKQPNFPTVDYPTPWIALAPRLTPLSVAAGPGRMMAMAFAVVLGALLFRWRPRFDALIWCCAVALCARCIFESVMDPFYLGPPLVMCLVAAAARPGRWRLPLSIVFAVAVTVACTYHRGEWAYWLIMTVLLALTLACGWPGRGRIRTVGAGGSSGAGADGADGPDAVPIGIGSGADAAG